ncbi:MAG: WG repeat-containing protein [Paludibacteraceae bacterium]|nr:WG repeat-containing protein [Paludibacteraceae bacterium]
MRRIVLFILLMLCTTNVIASDIIPKDSLYKNPLWWGKLLCFHNNKYVGLADSTGKVIVDARYNNVEYFGNGLYAIVKDSIAGIVNEEGTFVLPIKYRQIQNEEKFNSLKIRDCEGDVILEDTSGVVSRYDKKSNKIISAYKPYYLKRINNQTQYGEKGKVCLVDSNNIVVSGIYDKIYPFVSGRALAQNDSTVGFIDFNGKFHEDYRFRTSDIKQQGKYYILTKKINNNAEINDTIITNISCLLDSAFNVLLPFEYEEIMTDNDFVRVKKNGKYGIVSYSNEIIIAFEYDGLFKIKGTFNYIAKKDNYYGIISCREKKKIAPFVYDEIYGCYGEYSDKWYNIYIFNSNTNNFFDSYPIEVLDDFGGLVAKKKNKQYILSFDGEILSKGELEYGNIIRNKRKYGLVYSGSLKLPVKYTSIERKSCKDLRYYKVEKKRHFGICSNEGNLIIPILYDYIYCREHNNIMYFIVENKEGLKGAYSTEGKCILPVKYNNISYDAEKNQLVGEE